MKHLSFLTLLALAFAGFASAQSVTVSRDTVYEYDSENGNDAGPVEISFLNTTSDTLFTDTVIVDLLTSPVPDHIDFEFGSLPLEGPGGSIGISSREDYQFEQAGGILVPGVEYTGGSFCLEGVGEGMPISTCACNDEGPVRCGDRIEAEIRVRWYFTNGDSMSFNVKGDYIRDLVTIGQPVRSFPVTRETDGKSYLMNGRIIQPDGIRKTPLPIIKRSQIERE